MLKKIIIIEDKNKYQSDNLQDIVKELIDENYYNMTQLQRNKKMIKKALANCMNNNMEVILKKHLKDNENIDGKFIIGDEITYILSLLMTNNVLLLERKDSDIFTKKLNKNNVKENYIIVNKFAKKLLEMYLKNGDKEDV